MGYTTIAIKESTKKKLDSMKVHPNQPYDEIVRKLISLSKSSNLSESSELSG